MRNRIRCRLLLVIVASVLFVLPSNLVAYAQETTGTSERVTWTCVGSPCPWGGATSGHAAVWPSWVDSSSVRLGYETSAGVYAAAPDVIGVEVAVLSGSASVYAGLPGASSHRRLATVAAGQSYVVAGVASDEVVSVQSESSFGFRLTAAQPTEPTPEPTPEPEPSSCTDPASCTIVTSVLAHWLCDSSTCVDPIWQASAITWPDWAAYQDNARSGNSARRVFSADGEPLYPYMGSWADGCEVTAIDGPVLIIEWQRGTDVWRETRISQGQSHRIRLVAPEDGALIESDDYREFSVGLANCEPQPL